MSRLGSFAATALVRRALPDAWQISLTGPQHVENEDHAALPTQVPAAQLLERGFLYLLADGMGGHGGGAQASALAVSTAMDAFYRLPLTPTPTLLKRAIRLANQRVYEEGQRDDMPAMRTTLVAVVVDGPTAWVAHVGDSRAYLVNESQIEQLTTDHTMVAELERRGALTPEEARNHPVAHVVLRGVGGDSAVEVDIGRRRMARGDRILLVSDGVTRVLSDEELQRAGSVGPARASVEAVFAKLRSRELHDDATALLVAPRLSDRSMLALSRRLVVAIIGGLMFLGLAVWSISAAKTDEAVIPKVSEPMVKDASDSVELGEQPDAVVAEFEPAQVTDRVDERRAQADVDRDGHVGPEDLQIVSAQLQAIRDEPSVQIDPDCDVNVDGFVDLFDLVLVAVLMESRERKDE